MRSYMEAKYLDARSQHVVVGLFASKHRCLVNPSAPNPTTTNDHTFIFAFPRGEVLLWRARPFYVSGTTRASRTHCRTFQHPVL